MLVFRRCHHKLNLTNFSESDVQKDTDYTEKSSFVRRFSVESEFKELLPSFLRDCHCSMEADTRPVSVFVHSLTPLITRLMPSLQGNKIQIERPFLVCLHSSSYINVKTCNHDKLHDLSERKVMIRRAIPSTEVARKLRPM